jgi:hypothetical protein
VSARPVKVTVQPGHVVYGEADEYGQRVAHGEGQTLELPAEEAKVLAESGAVERE